jgi:hypothetical protein
MHKKLPEYSNIKTDYFPKNTTSSTQPLDQGIIKSVKDHYRAMLTDYLHKEAMRAEQEGAEFTIVGALKKITVTQAAQWINHAWFNTLQVSTITHCFEHAGFIKQPIVQTSAAEFDKNLAALINALEFSEKED